MKSKILSCIALLLGLCMLLLDKGALTKMCACTIIKIGRRKHGNSLGYFNT